MCPSTATRHLRRSPLLAVWVLSIWIALALCAPAVRGQTNVTSEAEGTHAASKFRSAADGWFDVSGFLEEKYGFLPIPLIITEPAVGYGGGVGLMFLSKLLPRSADQDFQRAGLVAMQFIPLSSKLFLGVRADAAASFGDEPFYLRPYISLRGAPTLRYQGEEVAQIEAELRWQLWKRFSLVGFVGGGAAWNQLESFNSKQTIVTGGAGFRYELARAYGLHIGLDVARSPDDTAVYLQIGSAWARP